MQNANETFGDFLKLKIPLVSQEKDPQEKEKINAEIYAMMKSHIDTQNKNKNQI